MSSTFGSVVKVSTFGESHSYGVGAVLEGCPPGVYINEKYIQFQLNRRRPKQNNVSTSRKEKDKIYILSGLNKGRTLGTPIGFFVKNEDYKSLDYDNIKDIPRPSHADYAYYAKYGNMHPLSGGGRSSARETVARVAAGTIIEKFLRDFYKIEIVAWVSSVGNIKTLSVDYDSVSRDIVDKNVVRCPDDVVAVEMEKLILNVKKKQDSIGGIITCVCRNVPAGFGEPLFDKFEAKLAHAMLSIPATKGFEIGSGFLCSMMKGSVHNDPFKLEGDQIKLKTNNSGGIQGGISTGNNIIFRVAFKPTPSIGLPQKTVDFKGKSVILKIDGRHDPCVVIRAIPVVEAMTALVLGDFAIRHANLVDFQKDKFI